MRLSRFVESTPAGGKCGGRSPTRGRGWVEQLAESLRDAAFGALKAARVLDHDNALLDAAPAMTAEEASALAAAHAHAATELDSAPGVALLAVAGAYDGINLRLITRK